MTCTVCHGEWGTSPCHDCGLPVHLQLEWCNEDHVCPECRVCGVVLESRYDQEPERLMCEECDYQEAVA